MNISAFLLLGTNMGDRHAILAQARADLAAAGTITRVSALYQTAAWGYTDQPDFINQALEIQTSLPAQKLLETCLAIEQQLGRERHERWGARTLDIDVILYGNAMINTPTLQVPHPRMALRRFVLIPMVEIAAEVVHPVLKKTMRELLEECTDTLEVKRLIHDPKD